MMEPKQPFPVAYLVSCVEYDPETGLFRWKFRDDMRTCWNSRWAGRPAFSYINGNGYKEGVINYEKVRAHRAAWAICTGSWPATLIDHRDGDRQNNRISNLRLATVGQNATNCTSKCGASQFLGVSWERIAAKWRARIMHDGRSIALGLFSNETEAALAYDAAAIRLHGEFARPNFPTTTIESIGK